MSLENQTKIYILAHKEFRDEYIANFKPLMSSQEFNLFRSYFIQIIKTKYFFLINSDYKFQLSLNILQVAFKAWARINVISSSEHKKDFFFYFFLSACIITARFDSAHKESEAEFIAFHEKCNYDIIQRCERAILCECHYKLYLYTPENFLEIVLKEFNHLNGMRKYKESICVWITFALSQYDIFAKYDYPTVVFACALITFLNDIPEDVDISNEEREIIKNEFTEYLRKQTLINKSTIENCGSKIIEIYEKIDEEEEEETEEENSKSEKDTEDTINHISFSSIEWVNGLLEYYVSSIENEEEFNNEDIYDDILRNTSHFVEIRLLGKKRNLIEESEESIKYNI